MKRVLKKVSRISCYIIKLVKFHNVSTLKIYIFVCHYTKGACQTKDKNSYRLYKSITKGKSNYKALFLNYYVMCIIYLKNKGNLEVEESLMRIDS